MLIWIFLVPGSVWTGSSQDHDEYLRTSWNAEGIAPVSLILKYNAFGQLAGLAHALPGAVWALLATAQVNRTVRNVSGGSLHRAAGQAMLAAAAMLMVGYAFIDGVNLHAELTDFDGHGGGLAAMVDLANRVYLGGLLPSFNATALRLVAAWFAFTGVQTWLAVRGSQCDVVEHRSWALRHIAAGLWVAGQRLLFVLVRFAQNSFLTADLATSPEAMGEAFYYSGYFTVALYIGFTEWVIQSTGAKQGPR